MRPVRQTGLVLCLWLTGGVAGAAADSTVRAGLEGFDWQSPETVHSSERALIEAIRAPLLGGRDCAAALQFWFDGRIADSKGDKSAATAAWDAGRNALAATGALLVPVWPELPTDRLRPLHSVSGTDLYLVSGFVVAWRSDAGQQYGLLMVPRTIPKGHRFPLLVYVHRGRDGIGSSEISWLAEQSRRGYAVVAPALRGQGLAAKTIPELEQYRCEGAPGDPADESSDVVTAMAAARDLPIARADACAVLGLGHGAVPALLAAVRSRIPTCVAVADAGRLDPFRRYWTRMARGERCWPEWAAFCNRDPSEQLAAMARQSVVLQAEAIRCPVLLLMADGVAGTLAEEEHRDVAGRLAKAGCRARLESLPGAPAGSSDDVDSEVCQKTLRQLSRFAYGLVPPDDGRDASLTPGPPPPEANHGP